MDYSSAIEQFLLDMGCSVRPVTSISETSYEVEIYYSDEEIETYLNHGTEILLTLSDVHIEEDMGGDRQYLVCDIDFSNIEVPGLKDSQGRFYDFSRGINMALSLLEEVAVNTKRIINRISEDIVEGQLWIEL